MWGAMEKTEAYRIVYEDLTQDDWLFTGKYDAENGNKHFMYGIASVMEKIAYEAGDYDGFSKRWNSNIEMSERKADVLPNQVFLKLP